MAEKYWVLGGTADGIVLGLSSTANLSLTILINLRSGLTSLPIVGFDGTNGSHAWIRSRG